MALIALLAFALLIPTAAFAAAPYDTGVDPTAKRELFIIPKDALKVDPQSSLDFAQNNGDAAGLQDATDANVKYDFKITKITPTDPADLSRVDPDVGASFTPIGDPYYIRSAATGTPLHQEADIDFGRPEELTGDPNGNTYHVVMENGAEAFTDAAMQTPAANLDGFIATIGTGPGAVRTADGIYMIQLYGATSTPDWYAVVQVPTLTKSAVDNLDAAGAVNYMPTIFPKVKKALTSQFSMYVDIVNKVLSGTKSDGTLNARVTADKDADWGSVGIAKGTVHTFTATMTVNGMTNSLTAAGTGGIGLGIGLYEAGDVSSLTATRNANNTLPKLAGYSKVANKYFDPLSPTATGATYTGSGHMEIGVLAYDINDKSTAVYAPLRSTQAGTGMDGTNDGAWQTDRGPLNPGAEGSKFYMLDAAAGDGQGTANGANPVMPGPHIAVSIPEAAFSTAARTGYFSNQATFVRLVADAILSPSATGGGTLAGMTGKDWSALNTKYGYTDIEEIYALDSNIKVELCLSVAGTVRGSGFRANDTTNDEPKTSEDFKPFLYGATNACANSNTVTTKDFFSWEAATYAGASPATPMKRQVGTEASVYTAAVNAVKLDNNGLALAGAQFGLVRDVAGTVRWATKGTGDSQATADTNAAMMGPAWDTAATAIVPNATFSNVYTQTTGADGKVSFDGVDPNDTTLRLVELKAPTGYKALPTDGDSPSGTAVGTPPTAPKFGAVLVPPVTLSWDSQAALKAPEGAHLLMTRVINVPVLGLPNTGGPGLIALIAIGIALIATGALIRRKGTARNEAT